MSSRLRAEIDRLRRRLAELEVEVARLEAQRDELLPVAVADARQGVFLGEPPAGHLADGCADCQWYQESTAFLSRVHAGEFGAPPAGDP